MRLEDLPFAQGDWRLALGLRPLQLQDWIEIDAHYREQLRLRERLMGDRPEDVFAALPGSEPGQQEILELLLAHLLHYFPQHYQRQGESVSNLTTGQQWRLTDLPPLALAGRLVQEDLCLLEPRERGYILTAAALCFPLRWRLREKIGLPLGAIHQHVPGYDRKLERPVDSVFDRLKPDYPGYRLNWSVVDAPDLFLDQPKHQQVLNTEITADNAGDRLWIRVERQTLRRLEKTGGVVFAIHTYVEPLSVLENRPLLARNLAIAIQKIPEAMQIYKNLPTIRDGLLKYLERISTVSIA
ncbi:MAG: DUF3445 domain-containing protein [Elainellaceae cyanobacterium]